MEWEVDKTEHFRYYFLFSFNRVVKAAEISREICTVRGIRTMPVYRQCLASFCLPLFFALQT